MALMSVVIRKQWALFKLPIDHSILRFRRTLFFLTLAIFIGNIIPAVIDLLTLFDLTTRPLTVQLPSVLYSFDNSITALLSSYLIWRLYRLAADERAITDFTEKSLTDKLSEK